MLLLLRCAKKFCAAALLVAFLVALWSLYFLTFPRPTSFAYSRHPHAELGLPQQSRDSQHRDQVFIPNYPQVHFNQKASSFRKPEGTRKVLSSSPAPHIHHLLSNVSELHNLNTERGRELFSRIKTNCKDRVCSEFLTPLDYPHFKYCVRKTWKKPVSRYREPKTSHCVFVNGTRSYPMGLASYPGSGNTWVRGLIQRTTGLCIGAIYCDINLRQNGYPGESIRSAVTFMVKTHQTDPRWAGVRYDANASFEYFKKLEHVPVYSGGVFILRNPFHALVSEYKRTRWEDHPESHVISLGPEYFGEFFSQLIMFWHAVALPCRGSPFCAFMQLNGYSYATDHTCPTCGALTIVSQSSLSNHYTQ